tara:strand:- start:6414 stop:7148 length:735 start_codon:yes stop_codon:yes gene_type:complete
MTTILTKKKDSSGVPATADITSAVGGAELAVNTADKRLYTKNSSNVIVEIGTNASELMVSGVATFRGAVSGNSTFNISGSAGISSNLNIGGTLGVTGDTDIANVSADGTLDVSGNVSVGGTLAVTNTITGASTVSDQDGDLRDIPVSQNLSGNYTLAIGDVGNQVTINTSNAIVTVPTGVFGIGDIISVVSVNGCTASLACTAVNAVKAGDLAATALHTLDANGVASIMFTYTANLAVLTGNIS